MKTKLNTCIWLVAIILVSSCNTSLNITKRHYKSGYYVSVGGGKNKHKDIIIEKPKNLTKNDINNSEKSENTTGPTLLASLDKSNKNVASELFSEYKNEQSISEKTKKNLTKPIPIHKKSLKIIKRNIFNSPHFLTNPSTPEEKTSWKDIPILYKIAIIFFLLCLLSLLFLLGSALFPTVELFSIIGATFPLTWLTGIIFSIIGVFKYKKTSKLSSSTPTERKRLNIFSKIALILEFANLLAVLMIVIGTFLIVFTAFPILFFLYLFCGITIISFVFSIIGLIKTLKDPQQSQKNRILSILISILFWVPVGLFIAWIVAVGAALSAVLPYLPFLMMLINGGK